MKDFLLINMPKCDHFTSASQLNLLNLVKNSVAFIVIIHPFNCHVLFHPKWEADGIRRRKIPFQLNVDFHGQKRLWNPPTQKKRGKKMRCAMAIVSHPNARLKNNERFFESCKNVDSKTSTGYKSPCCLLGSFLQHVHHPFKCRTNNLFLQHTHETKNTVCGSPEVNWRFSVCLCVLKVEL